MRARRWDEVAHDREDIDECFVACFMKRGTIEGFRGSSGIRKSKAKACASPHLLIHGFGSADRRTSR